ncbi:MAG: tRNA epoxyqueuosine(34) reductase QueG, partial [Bacteroidales bacterium]|nr:tRNA epoxyqueuosine(34) reductase QueG [Bacteroidales bacterium]
RLHFWFEQGYAADMHYMGERQNMRSDPRLLLEGAKTVVSCALAYKPNRTMGGLHRVAQYAYGEDYHLRMKELLLRLLKDIQHEYPGVQGRAFVDTAPISDKEWAVKAGLGWRGKNTLIIHPKYGSYIFLGELVLTSVCDEYDTPCQETCMACNLCVDACPNQALVRKNGTYMLDARRCNAYQTIENRAHVLPTGLNLAGYAFGCDCCQLACPYNQKAPEAMEISEESIVRLEALADADETFFRAMSKKSALGRIKYAQWLRNVRSG